MKSHQFQLSAIVVCWYIFDTLEIDIFGVETALDGFHKKVIILCVDGGTVLVLVKDIDQCIGKHVEDRVGLILRQPAHVITQSNHLLCRLLCGLTCYWKYVCLKCSHILILPLCGQSKFVD